MSTIAWAAGIGSALGGFIASVVVDCWWYKRKGHRWERIFIQIEQRLSEIEEWKRLLKADYDTAARMLAEMEAQRDT